MTKEVPTAKIRKVRFYTKASFPWAIIVVAVVFFSGVTLGWTMRSNDVARLDAVRQTALAEVHASK